MAGLLRRGTPEPGALPGLSYSDIFDGTCISNTRNLYYDLGDIGVGETRTANIFNVKFYQTLTHIKTVPWAVFKYMGPSVITADATPSVAYNFV